MNLFTKFIIISLVSGSILAGFLKIIQLILHSDAYILLFNMDYIPLLKNIDTILGAGYIFHYVFCFVSIIVLFYFAKIVHLQANIIVYVLVFTIGSGVLYFLTALTSKPPEATALDSWMYWVIAHALFGITVGVMIKYWVRK